MPYNDVMQLGRSTIKPRPEPTPWASSCSA